MIVNASRELMYLPENQTIGGAFAIIVIGCLSMAANLLVILAIIKKKALKDTPASSYIVALAIADFSLSAITTPYGIHRVKFLFCDIAIYFFTNSSLACLESSKRPKVHLLSTDRICNGSLWNNFTSTSGDFR
jgi:hypothetical protein